MKKRCRLRPYFSLGIVVAMLAISIGFNVQYLWAQPREQNRESLGDFIQEEMQKYRERFKQEAVPEELPEDVLRNETSEEPPAESPVSDTVPIATKSRPYLTIVQEKIHSQWEVPRIAGGGNFVTVVRFRLLRTGVIQDVVIEKASGSSIFDQAGRQAVLDAAPFPRFPPRMSEQYLDTTFTFRANQQTP